MEVPEFVFELHACRWAEIDWPPDGEVSGPVIVGRQLGTRLRRWDTIIVECDDDGLHQRAKFGAEHLGSDLLHVVKHAPAEWSWYRDALPYPGYPWRYVREAIHEAEDRAIVTTRKRSGRIELRRRWEYPEWVNRIIAIEHKPDLDASAARQLADQLSYDVAMGLADEIWLATKRSDDQIPPVLLEEMPVEVGILGLDTDSLEATVRWHPRRLNPETTGTRILERPRGGTEDSSAARFEFVESAEKTERRSVIAERAYERGWRSAINSMRPDCRYFSLNRDSLTHEPYCAAKECAQSAAECSARCSEFAPRSPHRRTKGWPIAGGPGKGYRALVNRQRSRHR